MVRGTCQLKPGTRDLVTYVVIGLGTVTVGTLCVFFIPERFWPHLTHTWFSFVFFTGLLGIVLVRLYWPARQLKKLWLLLAFLFVVHTVAYAIFLSHVQQWPAIWYLLTMPAEVMVIATIIKICLNVLPNRASP
jgi:hypothetical protein